MATYIPLLILFIIAAVLAGAMFTLSSVIGPKNPTPEKMIPYECGSETTGARHVKPTVKFYMTAILFVVLDVEVVLLYPWVVTFRETGWTGLAIMAPFMLLLVVALVYEWKKGAMEWER
ncbi:MAG: NAD(P)H-quinone oxidoreductase subunit 3 [Polyangiaceae bacterium]|nr:NAD(P)H-quinone oxidoreductase subunit 3 [Polyangiaceae bacterium]